MRSDKGGRLSIRHLFRIEYGQGHLFESDVDSKIQVFDLVSRDKAVDKTLQCWAETMLGVNVNSKVLMKTDEDKMVLTPRVFHPSPPSKLIDQPTNQTDIHIISKYHFHPSGRKEQLKHTIFQSSGQ